MDRLRRHSLTMCRSAISRIELGLVVLILALLAGLSLTLVVKVRATAAQTACQNNLKQIALGVLNFHDANNQLPPLTNQGSASHSTDIRSVFATLGPYLECSASTYRPGESVSSYHAPSSVPFTLQNKDGSEYTRFGGDANQVWSAFIDPADTTADGLRDIPVTVPDGTVGYYATVSYAANGLLPWGTLGRTRKLEDWPSGAILFTERPQVCRPEAGDAVFNLWGVGFYSPQMPAFALLTPTEPAGLWSTDKAVPERLLPPIRADHSGEMLVRIGRMEATPQPADFPTPVQLIRSGKSCDPRLPGSPHRGGMQAVTLDWSVRVFAPDTEPWVFWAACTLTREAN
ncbi:DUF1559 family PulG-like putative transporter [Frigoriglobus tundricola]|uniref:DUF1559 domain-containing protein n=1 Tax=Frigoriglobus tundricola TaxID=2774151 RepID=A0A6M5YQ59_9BACT|nr:DUF1559 domain-containing protein [Frigoriglobus tundricola]QJW96125.1 hypothetical protein FTUN_3680 [Frigoriglobus tundricola]